MPPRYVSATLVYPQLQRNPIRICSAHVMQYCSRHAASGPRAHTGPFAYEDGTIEAGTIVSMMSNKKNSSSS